MVGLALIYIRKYTRHSCEYIYYSISNIISLALARGLRRLTFDIHSSLSSYGFSVKVVIIWGTLLLRFYEREYLWNFQDLLR